MKDKLGKLCMEVAVVDFSIQSQYLFGQNAKKATY